MAHDIRTLRVALQEAEWMGDEDRAEALRDLIRRLADGAKTEAQTRAVRVTEAEAAR